MAYIPLPAPQIRNAMADFSGLQQVADDWQQNRQQNAMMEYRKQQDALQNSRADAQIGMQRERFDLEKKQFSREQSDAAIKRYAGVLQAIEGYPAEQRQALYARARQSMAGHDPEFEGELKGYGVDANDYSAVAPFVYGIARGYQAPKQPEVKEVNGRLVAVSPDARSAREIYSTPGTGNFKTGKEAADAAEGLRKEFTTQSKDFVTIRNARDQIDAVAKSPSPAGDISLVYSYMKILDPSSVVRETEYATAQNAAGVPDQVRNLWNRILSGERLNPQQRSDFVNQAKTIYGVQEGNYRRTQGQYRGISERMGLDPRDTMIEFAPPQEQGAPTQNDPSSTSGAADTPVLSPEQARSMPPGTVFRTPDGRTMRVPGAR